MTPNNYFKNLLKENKGRIFIGRENESRRMQQVLERRSKNHPLLVGEPGVGKKSIVGLFSKKIANKEISKNFHSITVLQLNINELLLGSKVKGDVDDRFHKALDTILSLDERHIIFIDCIENLPTTDFLKSMLSKDIRFIATASSEGFRKIKERELSLVDQFTVLNVDPPDVNQSTEILRGIASRYEAHHKVKIGEPAIISAITLAKRYVQDRCLPDSAIDLLDEACSRKNIELGGVPFAVDAAVSRLQSLKFQRASLIGDEDNLSRKVSDKISQEISELEPNVQAMVKTSTANQFVIDELNLNRNELIKNIKELTNAKTNKKFEKVGLLEHKTIPEIKKKVEELEEKFKTLAIAEQSNIVSEEDIAVIVGELTGIPVAKMLESESEKLVNMEVRLSDRVIGQGEALKALARAVRRGRVGLRDAGKPIGSFLFLGSSGVGKTEAAKALAEFLFDDEQAMTRIDMSEFMEKHMAQRLVGAPPGYANSDEGGFLTEAVRRRPYSVLLFDEIEKAHPDVFNLLLQVLDDGRLTDGRGKLADFSNTVVIMTSNIGSNLILDTDPSTFGTEEGIATLSDTLRNELKKFLRPEFLNRIDDTIIFRPLSKLDLSSIAEIQLKKIEKLLSDRELKLSFSKEAKQQLVDISYEPAFGARPLKRSIVKKIQDPMAEEILSGGYKAGDIIDISFVDDEFVFHKQER